MEPTIYDSMVFNEAEYKPHRALSAYPIDGELRWQYGTFVEGVNGDAYIIGPIVEVSKERGITPEYWCQVFPTTAGIATGFTDKNDVQIYTDDIIEFTIRDDDVLHRGTVVESVEGCFVVEELDRENIAYKLCNIIYDLSLLEDRTVLIVGNIYEHDEARKGD